MKRVLNEIMLFINYSTVSTTTVYCTVSTSTTNTSILYSYTNEEHY